MRGVSGRVIRLVLLTGLVAPRPAFSADLLAPVVPLAPGLGVGAAAASAVLASAPLPAALPGAAPILSPSAALAAAPVAAALAAPAAAPNVAASLSAVSAVAAAPAFPALPAALSAAAGAGVRGDFGARFFDGAEDVLRAERPVFTPAQVRRVEATDRALTAAVRSAARAVLGDVPAEVRSRGSTSRGTYVHPYPDYDINVALPASWSYDDFHQFLVKRSRDFKSALSRAAMREGRDLYRSERPYVQIDGPVRIRDVTTGRFIDGVALFHLYLSSLDGRTYIKVDVTMTGDPMYANPYPEYFERQLEEVQARRGAAGVERVLDDIRLAKMFFKKAVGAYKFYEGGPSAVGVEQLIMQSGKVSDADHGRTVLETGSFDLMMRRFVAAAYDANGRLRTFDEFRRSWTVHNPYMAPANFLDLLVPSWRRLAALARRYEEAQAAGRPILLRDLRRQSPSRPALVRATPGAGRQIVVVVRPLPRVRHVYRLLRQAARRLSGRVRVTSEPGPNGELLATFELPPDVDVVAAASRVSAYLERRKTVEVVSIAYAGETSAVAPATAPAAAVPASVSAVGAFTLALLDKFTILGRRPAERGEEFLYAQGAKLLPQGLESSWSSRAPPAPKTSGLSTARLLLLRRGGRTFAVAPATGKGREPGKVFDVPESLVQGVVGDALVEVSYDENRVVRAASPIGVYPQDMMIGRVVRRDDKLLLEGLFREGGNPVSLYAPLPLDGDFKTAKGQIVQAFVKPVAGGYAAVPLIDLGSVITPEIAAREIALRHGARGYFEEAVIRQAEALGRTDDPAGDYARLKARVGARGRVEDMRARAFVTIDPEGAGDLDDAFDVEKHPDGSYTWLLATANVANYVRPGTPGFRAAARVGNTFYSIDKDGVPEYPMNHPVVSKNLASLLAGKDSLAMITRMEFDKDGNFRMDQSDVFLGLVHVQGRYTYDQVAGLWRGAPNSGVVHADKIAVARELSAKLARQDVLRGKMSLTLDQVAAVKRGGAWGVEKVVADPLVAESHRLIEELKVYGNRVIGTRLTAISRDSGVPHISRAHPEQKAESVATLRESLRRIGVPWDADKNLGENLEALQTNGALSVEVKQAAQWLVLTSRQSASYRADDALGHEGLALPPGQYDHPSAPIRRFSDMYNRALLEALLDGGDPQEVYAAVLADLRAMGFESLEDYLTHLDGREQAARQAEYEVEAFMSVVELSKPGYRDKPLSGYVRLARKGRNPTVVIALRGSAATVVLTGDAARAYRLLDEVEVTVRGTDLVSRRVDAAVRKVESR